MSEIWGIIKSMFAYSIGETGEIHNAPKGSFVYWHERGHIEMHRWAKKPNSIVRKYAVLASLFQQHIVVALFCVGVVTRSYDWFMVGAVLFLAFYWADEIVATIVGLDLRKKHRLGGKK